MPKLFSRIGLSGSFSRCAIFYLFALFFPAFVVTNAFGHSVSVGYTVDGANTVTIWYGTYHDPVSDSVTNEGNITITRISDSLSQTGAANQLTTTKPAGLIDGTTNFMASSCPGGSLTRPLIIWQGRTFTGVPSGTYSIQLTGSFSIDWDPCDSTISSPSSTFTIDVDPPIFSGVPANFTVEATGSAGAVVNFTPPTAFDNEEGNSVTVTSSISSGAQLPLGSTTITFTAQDTAGNESTVDTIVTVVDTTAPAISMPANITVNADPATGTAVVSYTGPTATDIVDGTVTPTLTAGLASGAAFPIGTTTVSYQAVDAAGNTVTDSFTVTVNDTAAPVLTVPSDITVDADPATGTAIVSYTAPTATDAVDGAITPTLTAGLASGAAFPIGTTSVSYQAVDAAGNTVTGSFNVTVTLPQLPPVVTDDTGTAQEDTAFSVSTSSGLLSNDSDPNGDTLSVTQFVVDGTAYTAGQTANLTEGALTINANESYAFTPEANYNGSVPAITYTVSDGNGNSDTRTLSLTVTNEQDTPVATDDAVTSPEDVPFNIAASSGLLSNDTDVDGDTLSATQFVVDSTAYTAGQTANLTEGALTINADGSYAFTPEANYNGSVPAITYTVSDGNGNSDTGTLFLTVSNEQDTPVATDDAVTSPEDVPFNIAASSGLLSNDTDVDGDPLSVTQFVVDGTAYTAGQTANLTEGALTINADGSYVFTPEANYNGSFPAITYTVSDGNGNSDTGTLFLTVTNEQDTPVATDDTITAPEDMTHSVASGSGLLSNDIDPIKQLHVCKFLLGLFRRHRYSR